MVPPVEINILAVIVAGFIGFLIGGLWYSVLFGKEWMRLMGITPKKMKEAKTDVKTSYILGLISALVMSYVLAHIVDYAQAVTIADGAVTGFWVWLGFVAPVMLGSVLWENRPWKLYFINVSYYLVSLVVMGAVLSLWI